MLLRNIFAVEEGQSSIAIVKWQKHSFHGSAVLVLLCEDGKAC